MKTKNLMTAFALSAIFAACTQDAELNETLAKNDVSNIPMVEAEFTADFGVESRMQNKFGLEEGDKVGLAWLGTGDILTGNTTGMAYQNHPLFCTNAAKKSFKTETMLYVGKYFAYLPYTQGEMAIENIEFSIAEQPLTTNSDELGKRAIYLSTEITILEKADEKTGEVTDGAQKAGMGNNVKLNLALLNNPTTIKLSFKDIENLTDLKVTNVAVSMKNQLGNDVMVNSFLHNGNLENWTEMPANTFFATNSTLEKGCVNLKGELAVTNNALTTYALLLPAESALDKSLHITLTTNYGTVTATNVKVDNAKLFTHFGQVATVTADVDGDDIKSTTARAKTQEELNDILNKLAISEQEDAVTITLNPETAANPKAAFTLTDFILPEGLKAPITLEATGNAEDKIVFAGNTVINYPIEINSDAVVEGTMTINSIKNNNVQLVSFNGENLTVNNNAVLVNNGKMMAHVTTIAKTNAKASGKYISNDKDADLYAGSLTNNGEAQWIAGKFTATVSGNDIYSEALSLEDLKAAAVATTKVKEVRLMDGAEITNHEENVTIANIEKLIFCGDVTIQITDSYSGIPSIVKFSDGLYATVKENASLRIISDNKNNQLLATKHDTKLTVEKNASLYISNINLNTLDVINYGSVTTWNVTNVDIQNQNGGNSTIQQWVE